jgi:SAM-dependent methyltransferase
MLSKIVPEYVRSQVEKLKPWYHKINLGNGIITPGREYDQLWSSTHKVVDQLEYRNKQVLDLGSWDGYWAFFAEARGADQVVATDSRLVGLENCLFCKAALESKIIPLFNCKVQDLTKALDIRGFEPNFDIVHHLGLFYHLRDPYLSLTECRKVMKNGGILVLETACILDNKKSFLFHNGVPNNFHFYGCSDIWAPSRLCIKEMLERSMFKPVREEDWSICLKSKVQHGGETLELCRITAIAEAVEKDNVTLVDYEKMMVG